MLQILKIFLIFSLFPSISFAWNSSCYSPVQLAAYMSKPKKKSSGVSQSSVSKLKAKIRKLEKALDKVEGDLQDSLDKDKLKDKPSSVAGDIRNYIENKQDGWDCAEGGQSSLFFFPSLIPQAYAEVPKEMYGGNEESGKVDSVEERSGNAGTDCTESDGTWNEWPPRCDCPKGMKLEGTKCVDKPPQVSSGVTPANAYNESEAAPCTASGGTWKGGVCICKGNLKTEGNKCVDKPPQVSSGVTPANAYNESEAAPCTASGGTWKGGVCICKGNLKTEGNKCVDKPPQVSSGVTPANAYNESEAAPCTASGGTWKGGVCICKGNLKTEGNKCVDKPPQVSSGVTPANAYNESVAAPCTASDGTWENGGCVCKGNLKTEGNKCVKKEKEEIEREKCKEKGPRWQWDNNECDCKPGFNKADDGECRTQEEIDKKDCDKKEGWTWKNGKCVECPKWKKHSAFKSNGRVSSGFCDDYAKDKGDCKSALSDLREYAADLRDLQNHLDDLKDALREKSRHGYEDESDTEADGVCIDCLKRIIRSSQPSTGQVIGQSLGLLMGAGISVAGYRAGQNAQKHANMMRVQQGYPGMYDGFSLTGAGAGFPFMANSLYGMTRASTPAGGWACSPTVSPYGHTFNAGYGYGHNMRYY